MKTTDVIDTAVRAADLRVQQTLVDKAKWDEIADGLRAGLAVDRSDEHRSKIAHAEYHEAGANRDYVAALHAYYAACKAESADQKRKSAPRIKIAG